MVIGLNTWQRFGFLVTVLAPQWTLLCRHCGWRVTFGASVA